MTSKPEGSLTIVIPTYQRGAAVLDSVQALLALGRQADEILLVDQTPQHPATVERQMKELQSAHRVRCIRLSAPSIPHAMNTGLIEAKSDVVLFLDDDILPDERLIEMHLAAQQENYLVAGMVLQPGEHFESLRPDEKFRFNSNIPAQIDEFIGCNFSVRRDVALALGGFDENFVGAAYRFEAEFAYRYVARYGKIRFEPRAVIHHLQIASGGTRTHGHHLRTLKPTHSVGAYYESLRTRRPGWLRQMLWRPLRAVRTRHHLRQPWWIPVTLLAEARGFLLALRLQRNGPKLLDATSTND